MSTKVLTCVYDGENYIIYIENELRDYLINLCATDDKLSLWYGVTRDKLKLLLVRHALGHITIEPLVRFENKFTVEVLRGSEWCPVEREEP